MKVNIDNKEGLSKEQEDFIMKTVSVAIENYRRDKKLTPVVIMNNSKDDRTDIVMAIFGSQAEKEYTSQAIRKHVKRFLIHKNGHVCSICRQSKWNNQQIPLVCDHIDGDSNNSNLNNFRLVCCNCDAQLPTYKSKNKGNGRKYDRDYYNNTK